MANAVNNAGQATLVFARRMTVGLLEGSVGDAWIHQPFSGVNHALWTLGLIVGADDEFLNKLKERSIGLHKCHSMAP